MATKEELQNQCTDAFAFLDIPDNPYLIRRSDSLTLAQALARTTEQESYRLCELLCIVIPEPRTKQAADALVIEGFNNNAPRVAIALFAAGNRDLPVTIIGSCFEDPDEKGKTERLIKSRKSVEHPLFVLTAEGIDPFWSRIPLLFEFASKNTVKKLLHGFDDLVTDEELAKIPGEEIAKFAQQRLMAINPTPTQLLQTCLRRELLDVAYFLSIIAANHKPFPKPVVVFFEKPAQCYGLPNEKQFRASIHIMNMLKRMSSGYQIKLFGALGLPCVLPCSPEEIVAAIINKGFNMEDVIEAVASFDAEDRIFIEDLEIFHKINHSFPLVHQPAAASSSIPEIEKNHHAPGLVRVYKLEPIIQEMEDPALARLDGFLDHIHSHADYDESLEKLGSC